MKTRLGRSKLSVERNYRPVLAQGPAELSGRFWADVNASGHRPVEHLEKCATETEAGTSSVSRQASCLTLAPFLAGAGETPYRRFAYFNVCGAASWVGALIYAGAFFGSIPLIRDHLSEVTLIIAALSALPVAVTAIREHEKPTG